MKKIYMLIALVLFSSANAEQYPVEKYRELRDSGLLKQMNAQRDYLLQKRDLDDNGRDYRDVVRAKKSQKIYAQIQRNHSQFR